MLRKSPPPKPPKKKLIIDDFKQSDDEPADNEDHKGNQNKIDNASTINDKITYILYKKI